jgi:hypothetical protein
MLIPQSVVVAPVASAGIFHRPITGRTVRNDVVSSTNWSGYAVEATAQFTQASGTWTQPTASCTTSGSTYGSFWVGIDGYSSNSVEQLGTDSDCASKGQPSYYAWYEMYPAPSVSLSTTSYPVHPGDTLTATVSRSGTSYTLSLQSSRGWTFSVAESATNSNSSAEWVVEAPSLCRITCKGTKLTNFGTVSFSNSKAATGGSAQSISAFTANGGPHEIIMTSSTGTTRAQPTTLTSGGAGFSDTWNHA